MTDGYRAQVESAVAAARVRGFRSFFWFNQEETVLDAALDRRLPFEIKRAHLCDALAGKLYTSFYCFGLATPSRDEPPFPRLLSARETFLRELAAANCGNGYADREWTVHSVTSGGIALHKYGMTLRVGRRECPQSRSPASLRGEARLCMHVPKESRALSPGFYIALGDEPLAEEEPLVRLYWNLRMEGAVPLMHVATAALNEARVPFRVKAVNHPTRFTRRDAVILYTTKAGFPLARAVLERVYPTVAPYLKNGVPALTSAIAFGLGLAEGPPYGASFGLHRCRILAEGVLLAHERRQRRLADRLDTVVEHFAANHVSLDRPYVNSGTVNEYAFDPATCLARPRAAQRPGAIAEEERRPMLLAGALRIGRLLAQRAIWSRTRCNWMGMDTCGALRSSEAEGSLAYRALGPSLFTGTSGVAMFLAELGARKADPEIRRTAFSATEQALAAAPALRAAGHLGLYDGVTGIAVAAARVGDLLGEDRLTDGARKLIRDSLPDILASKEPDLLSGLAGIIVALLTLDALWSEAPLREAAILCGEELLRKAERQANRLAWRSAGFPKQRALLGLSHGAAGIGYALLELFRVTDVSRYGEAARAAFAYEDRWFDEESANWPDFRGVPAWGRPATHSFSFPIAWCHGAAGIALSRLRAYRVLKDDRYRKEALTALRTTLTWSAKAVQSEIGDFGLCHGMAGNASILAQGSRALSGDFPEGIQLAEEVAMAGLARYGEPTRGWPFGALGDRSPSLMLGLSGVGHFLLGLLDPIMPSLLMLEPECLRQAPASGAQG